MEKPDEENSVSRIGSKIDLKVAAKWTRYFRQRHPNETISHLFGKEIIEKILSQDDCQGIRIYYANSKPLTLFQRLILILINFLRTAAGTIGQDHLIITGTNKAGADQIPRAKNQSKAVTQSEHSLRSYALADNSELILAEQSMPCPASGCPSNELTGAQQVSQ